MAVVGNLQALNVLLPAFQALPEFEVVSLCGRNEAAVRAAAAKAGIAKSHSSWEPLVADAGVDVVALALPANLQAEAAVKLAAAGKHLFCEKPLAADLAGAQAICDAVAKNQKVATVNFGFRMVEAFRDFHAVVRSGILGAPKMIAGEWLLASRSNPALTWNWKSDESQGGGTLNLMASHVLDYLAWCFGDLGKIRLQTATLVPFRPEAESGRPKKVTADDTCNFLLELAPAIPASLTISTALPVAQGHRLRAWFEKGLLEVGNAPGDDYQDGFKLIFHPAKGVGPELAAAVKNLARFSQMEACRPGKMEVTRRVAADFARALVGRENHAPTLASALQVQAWMERARSSDG